MCVIDCFGFEQFGVRQDDTELVIELVEEYSKIARIWGIRATFGHEESVALTFPAFSCSASATHSTISDWQFNHSGALAGMTPRLQP